MSRLLIIITCLVGAILGTSYLASPISPESNQKIEFIVQSGQDLDQITSNLKNKDLIRSSSLAKLLIFTKGISKDIQAGYFYLSPGNNLNRIVSSLTEASSKQVWITIPEGLRRQEVASIIQSALPHISAVDFTLATKDLEGRLFPETYAFNPNASMENVIARLTGQLNKVTQSLSIPTQDLNTTLTLASLVEREAGDKSEMLEIAGILKKRLQANWPLQIDATVQFAIADPNCVGSSCNYWKNNLSKADLQVSSPYNTYRQPDLPPGPIASPGKEAIEASFKATTSPYWFYLHDLKGQVHFAKTIEDHNQNICLYLKKDCN